MSREPDEPFFIRSAGEKPTPPDWVAVPVVTGTSGNVGRVVYDPHRYDVMVAHRRGTDGPLLLPEESLPAPMADALEVSGWEPLFEIYDAAIEATVWVRDLDAAAEIEQQRQADGVRPAVTFEDAASVVPLAPSEGAEASIPDGAHHAVTFEAAEPTFPVVRPEGTGEPVPEGWVTEPFGKWRGTSSEVMYDPRRHACMRVEADSPPRTLENLASVGYELTATDQVSYLLVRDRLAHARTMVERLDGKPPPEVGGIGL